MAKNGPSDKAPAKKTIDVPATAAPVRAGKPSALLDTRVVYCGDNLEQLAKLPDACVDLTGGVYIDPPFNSNRNYEVFRGETKAPPGEPSRTATPAHRLTSITCVPAACNSPASLRPQENRQLLLPLRLARVKSGEPLMQGCC
jgi:hypothetical protein